MQKSEIDDRGNENESRLFCQIRLPGESFDMVWGWLLSWLEAKVNLWCKFILFYSPFVFDNIRLWRYSESRIAQLNSELFSFWEGQYWTVWEAKVSVFQPNPKLNLFNEICFQTILVHYWFSLWFSLGPGQWSRLGY